MPVGVGDWAGELLVWSALLAGLAGSLLPILPGAPLVLGGALLHKFLFPDALSWWGIAVLGLGVVLTLVLEWLGGMVGAKVFGASKWGVFGALVGGLVGLFFGLPGLIFGPIAGAFVGEWLLGRRPTPLAGKASLGVIIGILGANITHFFIALLMILFFVWDAYWW